VIRNEQLLTIGCYAEMEFLKTQLAIFSNAKNTEEIQSFPLSCPQSICHISMLFPTNEKTLRLQEGIPDL